MAFDASNYCKICASVLDYSQANRKHCQMCGWDVMIGEKESLSSAITITKEAAVKRWQKENAFTVPSGAENYAEMIQDCPKCGNDRLMFWTRQTRSADEGQTCYYQCAKCDYRKAENS
ncbi:unnamed protein product [Amoebophrya sp. A120]|nr:unnamed protein product [Amoebophrya sp. A120]|eukprot:GSA120T00018954001.1